MRGSGIMIEAHRRFIADLKIKAMMFDMDIDWDLLELTPKVQHTKPVWLERWLNRFDEGDNFPDSPEQNLDEEWE